MKPLYCVALALALFTPLTYSQLQLFAAEVRVVKADGEEARGVLLEWREGVSLTVPVEGGARGVIVRVDSSAPFKPASVAIDGAPVVPHFNDGVVLIEDFVWVNLSKFAEKPREITVWFSRSEPKPPLYAISEGGTRVWGYLIEVLLTNVSALNNIPRGKFAVLTMDRLTLRASLSNVTLWDVVILQTGGDLAPLLEALRGVSVETRIKTLYYSRIEDAREPLYVYVNAPSACGASLGAASVARDAVGRAFPGRPALLNPTNSIPQVGACSVVLVNRGPFSYSVGGVTIPAGSRSEVRLAPTSVVQADAYRGGVKAYSLTIYGLLPVMELPSYAYSIDVVVLDRGGELVNSTVAMLSGVGTPLREACAVVNGKCAFVNIPPGGYLVSIYAGGVEVGRETVTVSRSDTTLALRADLFDFDLLVLYPTGERVEGYSVELQSRSARYSANESRGRARFNDVPPGLYNYTVTKGGILLAAGSLKVEAGRLSYAVVANISRVLIKAVDLLGRPMPNVRVKITGPVTALVHTDSSGVALLDLPVGEYMLRLDDFRLQKSIAVRSGGECITISVTPWSLDLLAALALTIVIAAVVAKAVGGRRGVEIIDLNEP